MNSQHFCKVGIVILLIVMVSIGSVTAQDSGDIPQITIEATAEGLVLSDTIPEGAVTITVQNSSEAPAEADFIRLNEGKTQADLETALANQDIPGVLALGIITPGLPVGPGDSAEVTYNFLPGEYLLLNWPGDAPTEIIPFTVVDGEGEGAAAPEAGANLTLVNFAFNVPIGVTAGEQIWHIQNLGGQPHEVIIAGPVDDMTVLELNQTLLALLNGEDVEGPEPFLFVPPISPGGELWIEADLKPGAYVVVCTFPDISDNFQPHAALGMRQTFIVTE